MTPTPVIFFAFANDRQDRARYLRNLPAELRAVRDRFENEARGLCEVVIRSNATLGEILDVFQRQEYRHRIAVFHYGGHAGGLGLMLESAAGAPELAHSGGLAAFLGQQRSLQLVFLNGCSTEPQVEGLLAAGVPAVIATAESIDDEAATELAARFYAALASGAPISDAWAQAVGAVRAARGDELRDLMTLDSADPSTPDRWPWNLYVRPGSEVVHEWSLPKAAGNPRWGLPALPELDLPETPYRHLDWFREADAEIFFGRDTEIRDLYDHVVAPNGTPILLFCGQSGVGKSSLLDAGLIPYLRWTHDVVIARREREIGLAGTLQKALGSTHAESLRAAWRAHEGRSGRALVLILDQVEEAYTRPGAAGEVDTFAAALVDIFGLMSERPRGRLVLAFRKEWLADLETLLKGAGLPRSKFFLDRLGRAGIIDVVQGPTRSERLRRHYRLGVEPGVAEIIADDLLADPAAPVAPTLAVLLTKMWHQAIVSNESAPVFSARLYERHRVTLLEFLDEQLAALRARHPDSVDSGLALDVLGFHTTPLGTAEQRSWSDVETTYRHRGAVLPTLIEQAGDLHLLSVGGPSSDDGGRYRPGTRLVHDTLAPLVRMRFEESDKPGQRARRILESRGADWQSGRSGAPLDETDLNTVTAGANGTRAWNADEARLIETSRRRAAKARVARVAGWVMGLVAVATIGVLVVVALNRASIAKERETESTSRVLAAAATSEPQTDLALLLAVEAVQLRPTYEARNALLKTIQRPAPYLERTFESLAGRVSSVAFTPDGRQLVTGHEGTILLWDVATRQLVGDPFVEGGSSWTMGLAFSPDGAQLVSIGQSSLRLWDVATRQPRGEALDSETDQGLEGAGVAFSPDGRQVVSMAAATLRFWDVATRQAVGDPLGTTNQRNCGVAFSPNGRQLAWATSDGTVRFSDAVTRKPVGDAATVHKKGVYCVAYRPDGGQLASSGEDGTIQLWDPATRRPIGDALKGHTGRVPGLAYTPDGKHLISGGLDGKIQFWSVATRQPVGAPLAVPSGVNRLALSRDGRRLASVDLNGVIQLWALTARSQPVNDVLIGTTEYVNAVAYSPDGRQLATGEAGTVRVWNVATRRPVREPLIGSGDRDHLRGQGVAAIVYSADGRRLATAWNDGMVRLWDAGTLQPVGDPLDVDDFLLTIALSPDGRHVATGGQRDEVRRWDLASRQPVGEPFDEHTKDISAVAYTPDGRHLVSGGEDGVLGALQFATQQAVQVLDSGVGPITTLAFSPDGRRLVVGGSSGLLRLLDVGTWKPRGGPFTGHLQGVTRVAYSPDELEIASGGLDNTLRLWDAETGQQIGDPIAHNDAILDVAYRPDGQQLASATGSEVRLWDLDFVRLACASAGRNLPLSLWERRFPGREYRRTCAELALGEGVEERAAIEASPNVGGTTR